MKKLIKISGIILVVLVFIQALFVMLVVILSYYKIVTNFQVLSLIFNNILHITSIDFIIYIISYISYHTYIEYKSKKINLKNKLSCIIQETVQSF